MTYFYASTASIASTSGWDEITLANAMLNVSLSSPGLQRRDSRENTSSPMQLRRADGGWGSQTTRQTYRNDLCTLSQHNSTVAAPVNQQPASPAQSTGDYFNFDL
ncbi:expressed unknown protein [Seminavis robusta]|uniref:Uncharacterized protein n=1 Tax=Seminavis robusta TaxID=568900 RepID=A0A9N8EUL5_9STRA|nr:expressed unknown protein [Seminavis robusta]|eukprot:Sro1806_g298890.1 n/a (105) ;mRNA; f:13645-13959